MYALSYVQLCERYFLYRSLSLCNVMMSFNCRDEVERYGKITSVNNDGFYLHKCSYVRLKSGNVSIIDTLILIKFDEVLGYRIIDRGGDS